MTSLPRRSVLSRGLLAVASAAGVLSGDGACAAAMPAVECPKANDGEILGQGQFRYRAHRLWGLLDREKYPVKDCHGICEDRNGRIVLLTNDTRNNLIAYDKSGSLVRAWESRFPGAHGLEIVDHEGEDRYWITDQVRRLVVVCDSEGREFFHVGPEAVARKYPDLTRYQPTNVAVLPDGDFFISDGYGSSFIHHFDPQGRYIGSFGGEGREPQHLDHPHSVWIDKRSGKPQLLVCDRGHNMLKWFSLDGALLRGVGFGETVSDAEPIGAFPCNVAPFAGKAGGRFSDHLAVACRRGMILILNGKDRIVSAVGGVPPVYASEELRSLDVFNYTLNHPHDVHVDAAGALYVAQWSSNQTYPIKLEPVIG